jgi:hypothetical protein
VIKPQNGHIRGDVKSLPLMPRMVFNQLRRRASQVYKGRRNR